MLLNRTDLSIDESWNKRPILTKVDNPGWDSKWLSVVFVAILTWHHYIVPINVAISPNRTLLCGVSSSVLQGTHTSIHPLPRPREEASITDPKDASQTRGVARRIIAALRARRAPSDIIHTLDLPTTSLEVASSVLRNSLMIFSSNSSGIFEMWALQMLGVAVEVFRYVMLFALLVGLPIICLHLESRLAMPYMN